MNLREHHFMLVQYIAFKKKRKEKSTYSTTHVNTLFTFYIDYKVQTTSIKELVHAISFVIHRSILDVEKISQKVKRSISLKKAKGKTTN